MIVYCTCIMALLETYSVRCISLNKHLFGLYCGLCYWTWNNRESLNGENYKTAKTTDSILVCQQILAEDLSQLGDLFWYFQPSVIRYSSVLYSTLGYLTFLLLSTQGYSPFTCIRPWVIWPFVTFAVQFYAVQIFYLGLLLTFSFFAYQFSTVQVFYLW